MKPDKKEEKYLLELGNRVSSLREKAGWSVQELADKVDVTRAYIYRIERAMHVPGILVLKRIAKVLKVDLGDLVR